MAAGYCYSLGIKSNNFFLKDNKKAFILWLNAPKVTAYNQNYEKEYKTLDKKAIAAFYTTLSEPKEKSKLSFDDFILCTANIKNIADLLTISLLPNINWEQLVLNNREQLIPKYERFVHGGRTKRLQTYVLNCIRTLYGYTLDELTINNIIGSLE